MSPQMFNVHNLFYPIYFLKNLEYVSPYLSSNVEPNVETIALQNLTNDFSLQKIEY